MNIIRRELRAHMKSLLIWIGCIAFFIAIMMSEFSAYANNPEMGAILDSMPKALLDAFSISGSNLTTVSGFLSIASVYFFIMLAIYAVLLGSSIISKEERDKTVEFFLTLPISRQRVIISKWISAVINCIIINAATGLVLYITTAKYEPDNDFYKFLGLMLLGMFIVQMIFLSIGMLLAAIMKRYRKSGTYSVSILLVTYILSVLVGLSDKVDFLKYFTPFKYFKADYILLEGTFEGVYLLISLGIIAVSTAGIFIFYSKRDLHI
ncbi:MAG: ABC transporter permease subunit [Bacteroidetes bacterium]|nr:ABC transporter permease subunit [Bacteroidota bacterium]